MAAEIKTAPQTREGLRPAFVAIESSSQLRECILDGSIIRGTPIHYYGQMVRVLVVKDPLDIGVRDPLEILVGVNGTYDHIGKFSFLRGVPENARISPDQFDPLVKTVAAKVSRFPQDIEVKLVRVKPDAREGRGVLKNLRIEVLAANTDNSIDTPIVSKRESSGNGSLSTLPPSVGEDRREATVVNVTEAKVGAQGESQRVFEIRHEAEQLLTEKGFEIDEENFYESPIGSVDPLLPQNYLKVLTREVERGDIDVSAAGERLAKIQVRAEGLMAVTAEFAHFQISIKDLIEETPGELASKEYFRSLREASGNDALNEASEYLEQVAVNLKKSLLELVEEDFLSLNGKSLEDYVIQVNGVIETAGQLAQKDPESISKFSQIGLLVSQTAAVSLNREDPLTKVSNNLVSAAEVVATGIVDGQGSQGDVEKIVSLVLSQEGDGGSGRGLPPVDLSEDPDNSDGRRSGRKTSVAIAGFAGLGLALSAWGLHDNGQNNVNAYQPPVTSGRNLEGLLNGTIRLPSESRLEQEQSVPDSLATDSQPVETSQKDENAEVLTSGSAVVEPAEVTERAESYLVDKLEPIVIQKGEGISQAFKRVVDGKFGTSLSPKQALQGALALWEDNGQTSDPNLVYSQELFVGGDKTENVLRGILDIEVDDLGSEDESGTGSLVQNQGQKIPQTALAINSGSVNENGNVVDPDELQVPLVSLALPLLGLLGGTGLSSRGKLREGALLLALMTGASGYIFQTENNGGGFAQTAEAGVDSQPTPTPSPIPTPPPGEGNLPTSTPISGTPTVPPGEGNLPVAPTPTVPPGEGDLPTATPQPNDPTPPPTPTIVPHPTGTPTVAPHPTGTPTIIPHTPTPPTPTPAATPTLTPTITPSPTPTPVPEVPIAGGAGLLVKGGVSGWSTASIFGGVFLVLFAPLLALQNLFKRTALEEDEEEGVLHETA